MKTERDKYIEKKMKEDKEKSRTGCLFLLLFFPILLPIAILGALFGEEATPEEKAERKKQIEMGEDAYLKEKYGKEYDEQQKLKNHRMELKKQGIPSCPKCGSTHVTTLFGINPAGSYNTCGNCGFEYYPSNDKERKKN